MANRRWLDRVRGGINDREWTVGEGARCTTELHRHVYRRTSTTDIQVGLT